MLHRLHKTFHGWFFPKKQSSASAPAGSRVFVGTMGRLSAAVARTPHVSGTEQGESFVYLGCIHGGTDGLYHRIEALAQHPPDYLICCGDLTGSAEMERLKKAFYDEKASGGDFGQYEYFGQWAATLPKERREALLATIAPRAEALVRTLSHLRKKGTKVMLLEGNWDNPMTTGVRAIAGSDIKHPFSPRTFFARHGFHFISTLDVLETGAALHVFLPYITLLHFHLTSSRRIQAVRHRIRKARGEKKRIILVGHAEANWRMHNLFHPAAVAGSERQKVIHHFSQAIALFAPDEVIYPHQHERMVDEQGRQVDLKAKYLLQVIRSHPPHVRLVEKISNERLPVGSVIATYIPMGYTAQENFLQRNSTMTLFTVADS